MMLTSTLLLPGPHQHRVTTTPAHPQLRDLVVVAPESASVSVICYEAIARHDLFGVKPPEYTRLGFAPSSLVYGCGLIAAGGQSAELSLKAADPASSWCHQTICPGASINNSICISPSPLSATTPRLLVSNNDETIKVYEVAGRIPDYARSKRRRLKARERVGESEDEPTDEVEETGVHDLGGECSLVKVPLVEIQLNTAINHSSVSPDGRRLVAVGDTNEIFLFDVKNDGSYERTHTFVGSADAAFSSDWSGTSDKFAVASQDGFVHVFDIRNLPPSSSSSSATAPPRKLATLKTSQSGPAGAARKVKFSPGRISSELLAFTEHRSKVHVVDARTFDLTQLITVPATAAAPPPRAIPSLTRTHPDESQEEFIVRILEGDAGGRAAIERRRWGMYHASPQSRQLRDPSDEVVESEEEDCPPEEAVSRLPPPLLRPPPSLSGYAPLAFSSAGYQATSLFFPVDSTPEDLLGLDWDEWGERLFVATEGAVWEWEVDGRARRCFGAYGFA